MQAWKNKQVEVLAYVDWCYRIHLYFFLNHSLKQLVKGQRNISLTTMYYLVYGKIEN